MDEFKNNKDSKLKELKGDIAKQKTALSKQAAALKTFQKELQTASLELGAWFLRAHLSASVAPIIQLNRYVRAPHRANREGYRVLGKRGRRGTSKRGNICQGAQGPRKGTSETAGPLLNPVVSIPLASA